MALSAEHCLHRQHHLARRHYYRDIEPTLHSQIGRKSLIMCSVWILVRVVVSLDVMVLVDICLVPTRAAVY